MQACIRRRLAHATASAERHRDGDEEHALDQRFANDRGRGSSRARAESRFRARARPRARAAGSRCWRRRSAARQAGGLPQRQHRRQCRRPASPRRACRRRTPCSPVGVGMIARQPWAIASHLRRRVVERPAGSQAADDRQIVRGAVAAASSRSNASGAHTSAPHRKVEARRHDADDQRLRAVDQDRASDDRRIGAEAPLPQPVAEDDACGVGRRFPLPAGTCGRAPAAPSSAAKNPATRKPCTRSGSSRPTRFASHQSQRRQVLDRAAGKSRRQSRKSAARHGLAMPRHPARCWTGITIRSTSGIVKGCSSSASMTPKTAALAPMPSASVSTIVAVVVGCLTSERSA